MSERRYSDAEVAEIFQRAAEAQHTSQPALPTAQADVGMMTALGSLAAMGTAMFAAGGLRLPGWARLRRQQMEQVAARATTIESGERLPDLHDGT